jgi:iron complex outermembrane recepter protein
MARWKTTWLDNTLRVNGAVFIEDWKDFQYAFLGPNSLTLILNAGQARIKGLESDFEWAATHSLNVSGGFTALDPKLTNTFCGGFNAQGGPATDCAVPQAPAGSQLPVTPKFKGNLTGRYSFDLKGLDAYVQGSYVYQGKSKSNLKAVEARFLGDLPAYGIFNLSAGLKRDHLSYELSVSNLFDDHGQIQRFAECPQAALSSGQYILDAAGNPIPLCASQTYVVPTQPRTIQLQMGWKY